MKYLIWLIFLIGFISCNNRIVDPEIELTLNDYINDYDRIVKIVALDYHTGEAFWWQLPFQSESFYEGYKSVAGTETNVEFIGGFRTWNISSAYVYGADILISAFPYSDYVLEYTIKSAFTFSDMCAFYSTGYPYRDERRTYFDTLDVPLNLIVTGFGITYCVYSYPIMFYDVDIMGYTGTPQLFSANSYIAGKYCALYDISNNFGKFSWEDITLACIETSTHYGKYDEKNGYGKIQPYRALLYLWENK